MNKSEKNFDAGLRVLEVLKVLLNENLKKIELIEKLKSNTVVECVYTQEAFVKYFNTLEALGFELERIKNQYILSNALFKIDLSKEEKELLERLITETNSLYNKNFELSTKTAFNKIIGFMVGSVIFQKHSQPEPPSIFAASYKAGSTFCRAERKIRI